MYRSRLSLGAVVAASLLLAGCGGGGDDEAATTTAAPEAAAENTAGAAVTSVPATPTTAPDTTAAPEATTAPDAEAPEGGDGDTIFVNSFDEMPDECVSMLEDFLREVEPVVSQIDWATASSADLQTLFESNSELFDGFDEEMASTECDRYEFEDDAQTTAQMIPIAEEVAPGAVAWLTTMDQIINATGVNGEPVAGAPATCDEAIAAIDAAIAEGKQLSSVPISEMGTLTAALTVLAEDCTPEQLDAFYSREDVGEFLG
jgi:hypothetical protein